VTITATDLFCGAGGSSLGAEHAGIELKMAANHWPKAIEVHQANFPNAGHDCADISQADPRRYPRTNMLLASPECTNHSNAKGISRKAQNPSLFDSADLASERSRATMWDVPRFVEEHRYEAVVVENVVDAGQWIYWRSWWATWADAGYDAVVVNINSAHTGLVHQWRDRIYIVAVRKGLVELAALRELVTPKPPCWCETCEAVVHGVQTFKKPGIPGTMIGKWRAQYAYRCPTCRSVVHPPAPPAADVIDWTLPAGRIGDRVKPLAPNTRERIRRGLAKYGPHLLAGQGNTWDGVNTGSDYLRAWPLTDPTPVQACRYQHAVAHPPVVVEDGLYVPLRRNAEARPASDGPFQTVAAGGQHHSLVMAPQADGQAFPSYVPAPTATTRAPSHLIVPYYGQSEARPTSEPHGTCTTRDREGIATVAVEVDDCHYRMLDAHEVQAAMAFPTSYVLPGKISKTEKVKLWGNAVTPPVMAQLVAALRTVLEPGASTAAGDR
jgi:DNA (cytosine-5)-methyltransferase 1